jgi:adenylylsulfate reductase subunit B
MSIEITPRLCIGCGLCAAICPGSLIDIIGGMAVVGNPERCWGCASCVKECPQMAIALYLGADIGGLGGKLTVRQEQTLLRWTVKLPDGSTQTITTDRAQSSQY